MSPQVYVLIFTVFLLRDSPTHLHLLHFFILNFFLLTLLLIVILLLLLLVLLIFRILLIIVLFFFLLFIFLVVVHLRGIGLGTIKLVVGIPLKVHSGEELFECAAEGGISWLREARCGLEHLVGVGELLLHDMGV